MPLGSRDTHRPLTQSQSSSASAGNHAAFDLLQSGLNFESRNSCYNRGNYDQYDEGYQYEHKQHRDW